MKKVILPLLLILAVGILAAVESAPSAVVGYVKYDCLAGNNLIALPMEQGYTTASEIAANFSGTTDAISYFDPTLQDWTTAVDLGGFWDGDFAIAAGSVVMVYGYSPCSFFSMGSMPAANASYGLLTGLNTIMIPLNRSDLNMAGLVGADVGTDAVSYFDATLQDWTTAVDLGGFWDGDFATAIGSPLMVYAYSDATWPSTRTTNNVLQKSK